MNMESTEVVTSEKKTKKNENPNGFKVIWREILRDKLALISLIFFVLIALLVFVANFSLDQKEIVTVDIFQTYAPPSADHWLGTDYGGRDIFGQLIIGTFNSLSI